MALAWALQPPRWKRATTRLPLGTRGSRWAPAPTSARWRLKVGASSVMALSGRGRGHKSGHPSPLSQWTLGMPGRQTSLPLVWIGSTLLGGVFLGGPSGPLPGPRSGSSSRGWQGSRRGELAGLAIKNCGGWITPAGSVKLVLTTTPLGLRSPALAGRPGGGAGNTLVGATPGTPPRSPPQ